MAPRSAPGVGEASSAQRATGEPVASTGTEADRVDQERLERRRAALEHTGVVADEPRVPAVSALRVIPGGVGAALAGEGGPELLDRVVVDPGRGRGVADRVEIAL